MGTAIRLSLVPNGQCECNIEINHQATTFCGSILSHPVQDLLAATSFLLVGGTVAQCLFRQPCKRFLLELKRDANDVAIKIVKFRDARKAGEIIFFAQTHLIQFANALYWAVNGLFNHLEHKRRCPNWMINEFAQFQADRLYMLIKYKALADPKRLQLPLHTCKTLQKSRIK